MNTIIKSLQQNKKYAEVLNDINNKKGPILLSGLTDVAKSQIISAIGDETKRNILVITYNELQAKKLLEDLKYFTQNAYFFRKKEIVTYDYVVESFDNLYERIKVLNELNTNKKTIIVTTIEAAMQKMIPKNILYKNKTQLKVGDMAPLEELKQKLVELGYERQEMIEGNGGFSVRGGIIDISISENTGVRVELWGDEIDSIRYFSIASQRSTKMLDKIQIFPLHEYLLEIDKNKVCENILNNDYTEKQLENVNQDIETIKQGNYISKIDKYIDEFYKKPETILDYIKDDSLIFLDENSKITARVKNIDKDQENLIKSLAEKEKVIPQIIRKK